MMLRLAILCYVLGLVLLGFLSVARAPHMTCAGYQEMSFRNPARAAWMRETWQRSCRWTE